MYEFYKARKIALKKLDRQREKTPNWYKGNQMLDMMMYVDAFAGNLKGVKNRLDYIAECNVNYIHLMPLLDSPEGRSDGGYAVSDFRKVKPELGSMEDLECLAEDCHGRGMSICLDFVMNHTSEDYEWARRVGNGEKEYQDRYYFYDNYDIPAEFERTVPEVFPTTAPGNFTQLPELGKFVMTTFYPYQWDLNYWNPIVFNEMVYNMLNHSISVNLIKLPGSMRMMASIRNVTIHSHFTHMRKNSRQSRLPRLCILIFCLWGILVAKERRNGGKKAA